jgi:hypothetical protein
MFGKAFQHMVEKSNAGFDLAFPSAIEIQDNLNAGLFRGSVN